MENILADLAPRQARNIMRATVHGLAIKVRDEARKGAPKQSGTLKKAIKAERRKSHPDKPMSQVWIASGKDATHDAYYWRFVEYGTVKQRARPFVAPAKEKVLADREALMRAEFGRKLEAALARARK